MKLKTRVLFFILIPTQIWSMEECKSTLPKHVINTPQISPRHRATDKRLVEAIKNKRENSNKLSPLANSTRKKQNGCEIILATIHCNGKTKTNHTK